MQWEKKPDEVPFVVHLDHIAPWNGTVFQQIPSAYQELTSNKD